MKNTEARAYGIPPHHRAAPDRLCPGRAGSGNRPRLQPGCRSAVLGPVAKADPCGQLLHPRSRPWGVSSSRSRADKCVSVYQKPSWLPFAEDIFCMLMSPCEASKPRSKRKPIEGWEFQKCGRYGWGKSCITKLERFHMTRSVSTFSWQEC